MKAAVYDHYGPPEVVEIREVPRPEPGSGEVLIRVYAATVTAGDWRLRSMNIPAGFKTISRLMFGVIKPRAKILGSEIAGTVEAVGAGADRFQPGDAVVAFNGSKLGGHAEFVSVEEKRVIAKPANISFQEAAPLCFGGTTALDFFRRGKLKAGEKVLINGASGAVGSAAVQLAKNLGAEVTGVCSTNNVELVRSLGADHVVDYRQEDFTQSGRTYDVIMDTAGTASYSRVKGSLGETGRLLKVLGTFGDLLQIPLVALTSKHRVVGGPAAERPQDMQYLARLAETGRFKPVIDRQYSLEEIVEAHRRVDTGHKRGNVVVLAASNATSPPSM